MMVLPFLASCGSGNSHVASAGGDTLAMDYARNINIVRFDGFTEVSLRNPWDTTAVLTRYILVPDSLNALPQHLPQGEVIRVPLKRGVVYSSVHIGLLSELGAAEMVKGVCDARYLAMPEISSRIESGDIVDCGAGSSPSIEKIISLSPDAIVLSPYEHAGGFGKIGQLGIPLIQCADYMESDPLARAEWIKFYGLLSGQFDKAVEIYNAEKEKYLAMKQLALSAGERPRVLIDRLYGNSWYVPGRLSTMGRFISDAGGQNPFDYLEKRGSVALSGEKVFYDAGDADVWLVRYSQQGEMTRHQLGGDNAIYPRVKAFKENRVFGCNTTQSQYYARIPFHPHLLLTDMIAAFHPGLLPDSVGNRFFKPLK